MGNPVAHICSEAVEMSWALLRGVPEMFALLGGIALVVWHAAALVCIVVALVSVAAALAAIWLACIARRELDDPVDDMTWDGQALTQLRRREDHGPQNHFATLTSSQSGPLRAPPPDLLQIHQGNRQGA